MVQGARGVDPGKRCRGRGTQGGEGCQGGAGVTPFGRVGNCSKEGEGSCEPLFLDPFGGGGGALLSGHYRGRQSARDRREDQKPRKQNENGRFEISA